MQAGVRGSIVVSISACHADDPGSIPGRGVFCAASPDCNVPAMARKKNTSWQDRTADLSRVKRAS